MNHFYQQLVVMRELDSNGSRFSFCKVADNFMTH